MHSASKQFVPFTGFAVLFCIWTSVLAGGFVELERDFAPDSDVIDNPWWPLPEGIRFVYTAIEDDECIVSLVDVLPPTDPEAAYRPEIDSTKVRTVRDAELIDLDETCDGEGVTELLELTLDWYAQDKDSNVWYFGEHTVALPPDAEEDECERWTDSDEVWGLEGCLDGAWEAGTDVADVGSMAEPGIIMLAKPEKGLFYFQEYYEDVATDMGKVLSRKDVDSPIHGEVEACWRIKEWVPLEPGNVEHKYYCEGLGLLTVGGVAGGKTVWTDLVDVTTVPQP